MKKLFLTFIFLGISVLYGCALCALQTPTAHVDVKFNVKKNESSILNFGDLSILSFHATKVFNTIEGGAVICHDSKTKQRLDYLKNFGIADETTVVAPGINAKMNELQAAYGLLQLKDFDIVTKKRKALSLQYKEGLRGLDGIRFLDEEGNVAYNYAYFPIFVDESECGFNRDDVMEVLKKESIFARRYFYPLISEFPPYRGLAEEADLKTAHKVSREVICLPLYPGLPEETVELIIAKIKQLHRVNSIELMSMEELDK